MPPPVDHVNLRRSMNILVESLSDCTTDFMSTTYREITSEGLDGDERAIFMLGRSVLRKCFKVHQPSILEAQFALYHQIDSARPREALTNLPNFLLFRKNPMPWGKLLSMQIPTVSLRMHEVVRECASVDAINDESRRDNARYNRQLVNCIKIAVLFRHLNFQIDVAGFYRPPSLFLPIPMHWSAKWADTLNQMDGINLPIFTQMVNQSSNEHLRNLLDTFNEAANDFQDKNQLLNADYWIAERLEPYEFVARLQVYHEIARKIIALSTRIMAEQSKLICETQTDLATVISTIVEKYVPK